MCIRDSTQSNKNTLKCYLAVNFHCQKALLVVLHNNGVPSDPVELYKFFNNTNNLDQIRRLENRKILKKDQVNLLLPQNQRTFSEKWDITLICVVIINFSTLPSPNGGWEIKVPDPTDITASATVINIRQKRNIMNHASIEAFQDDKTFGDFFTEIGKLLARLKYKNIDQFKAVNIDSINPLLFDPASFMKDFQCLKDENDVIEKCLQWYKEEKEKSKSLFHFIFNEISKWPTFKLFSLISFFRQCLFKKGKVIHPGF